MALAYVALSCALALLQRPGRATSDTKIDLHVDPAHFVGQVASVWSPRTDLGAVQSAQYSGYLWPVAPFYAVLRWIGFSPWVVERLWLAAIFSLSAWGALRLMDVLVGRPRGVAHAVAAAVYVLNPYTVMFTGRTSIALVGYAALPWLLLVVHHGVRSTSGAWRGRTGWAWAAVFALVLTSLGGGINGAVVGWMLVGPLVLLVHEPLVGAVRWRDAGGFLLRMGVLGTLASLWWIIPLVLYSRYGVDFLQFTEQPGTIWATNNAAEALRLMAYWTSYTGFGFRGTTVPFFTESGTLLFNPLVVGASLLVPALAILGFTWTRRWRYGPFFLLLLLVGMVVEVAGFPEGTPARHAMVWIYRNVSVLSFMRTTQKAAPLVAMGIAGLLGLGAQLAFARLRGLGPASRVTAARVAVGAGLALLIGLAALPLVRGTATERQLTWDHIPAAWTRAGEDLDRTLAPNTRAMVLPGQIFGYYDWGGTVDAILPRLTRRPVAVRYETPYSDPHATDLLVTTDRLVQQERLYPGQLLPLLRLMGVGAVVSGTDDDLVRSGAVDPASAAATLAGQGLGRPSRSYGPVRTLPAPRGSLAAPQPEPQVRRYDLRTGRGLVHVEPVGPATVVDGGAEGVAALAAFGALPADRPLLYAGDLSADELRREAAAGASVVVSDSNRRRRFLPEFTEQNLGATVGEADQLNDNWAQIDPFPDKGTDGQTVAVLQGAKYVTAPAQGGLLEFPEHTPSKAFDGDPSTVWAADRYRQAADRWIEIGFAAPRDVPYVDLEPIRDPYGVEREVDVNGVHAKLGPGVTRVRLDQRGIRRVRVTITKVDQPPGDLRGSGGFREIRVPGVRVRRLLRTPLVAGRALAGRDLSRTGLTYLFERDTADSPFRRNSRVGSPLLERPQDREDPEQVIDRALFAPATRRYAVDARVQVAPDAPDPALDRLVGLRGAGTFTSSDRFGGTAATRASSAFDGRPDTAWLGLWAPPSAASPWIAWSGSRTQTLSTLRLRPARSPVRRPTVVRVSWPGGRTGALRVGADGTVTLPRPVRARAFRITVLETSFPPGLTARQRAVRAVGIGAVEAPGLAPVAVPRSGPLRAACGSITADVGGRRVALRPAGTVADVLAGRPLRARACDGAVTMTQGIHQLRVAPGTFAVDLLRLRSPSPQLPPAPTGGGRVVDPGHFTDSSVRDARVALTGPSWLVLGQSFSEGWRATCDGRSLGAPRVLDGYANGWRAPADCRDVSFTFAPQRAAVAGYAISGLVCAVLLVLLAAGALAARRRRTTLLPAPVVELRRPLPDPPTRRMGLLPALGLALALTAPLCLLFALRTSILLVPGLTFILWRGLGPRTLTVAAAALVGVVVPAIYLIASPRNRGGYNFEYSIEVIYAHWASVAALVLLMVACGRTLAAARSGARPPAPEPVGDRPAAATPAGDPVGAGHPSG
jgi:hypothetical protein